MVVNASSIYDRGTHSDFPGQVIQDQFPSSNQLSILGRDSFKPGKKKKKTFLYSIKDSLFVSLITKAQRVQETETCLFTLNPCPQSNIFLKRYSQ